MQVTTAELAAVALAVVLLLVLITTWRSRRSLRRRLAAVSTRLEAGVGDVLGKGGIEASLARLERAADAASLARTEAVTTAERFAEAAQLLHLGVVVADENGDVVFRNERAGELLASRHEDALYGDTIDDLLASALAGERAARTLEVFGPPRRTLTIDATPVDNGSRTVGAVAVIEDVSERKRLEAVRRDFVANVSHELKTPVGALGLLAETLAGEDDPATVRRFTERMQLEATRVARIIDDLLDLSRIEAEEAPVREPVAVNLVVAEAVERVRQLAEHAGMAIEVGEAPKRLSVVGDRRQLVSALHNLLENAIKYSDAGSTVQIGAWTDGTVVEIAVRDQGIGIPARDLDRIFERFYRVDRARSRETGGTGLGLSIVRHVAGAHRGEVKVSSKEGEGSTFTLRLPAGPGPVLVTTTQAEAG